VADGIHQSVFPKGGKDLSFGENCRKVINCMIYLINDLNLSSSNLLIRNLKITYISLDKLYTRDYKKNNKWLESILFRFNQNNIHLLVSKMNV